MEGKCSDPCIGFSECGTNAVCQVRKQRVFPNKGILFYLKKTAQVVSHAATCRCPEGLRELNSPYVACVPEGMNLARLAGEKLILFL